MGIIAEQWLAGEGVQVAVHRARGLSRLTGLLLRGAPQAGEAFLIPRCSSVHGIGMREPLDAVFVAAGRVLAVRELRPLRVASCHAAEAVFELRSGEAARLGLVPGTALRRSNETRGGAGRAPARRG